jgi:cellulose synthase/poly-beta-1,6-N-acetylglucosamine synthase-like glycosyltransferase
MELTVRLHRYCRENQIPYRIAFLPDPVCWTEAPENWGALRNQRIRWHRHLAESLMINKSLFFNRRGGYVGWLAFPFVAIFEMFGPALEVLGYLYTFLAFFLGILSYEAGMTFLILAIGFGILLSFNALLLEEMSFHQYPRMKHVFVLFWAAIFENLGYRQINSVWRLIALFRWARGGKGEWDHTRRSATWNGNSAPRGPAR